MKASIETGRYEGIVREERTCAFCDVLEDEQHAIYDCRAYNTIRDDFRDILEQYPTVKQFLNPQDKETAEKVGMMLKLIEEERKLLI